MPSPNVNTEVSHANEVSVDGGPFTAFAPRSAHYAFFRQTTSVKTPGFARIRRSLLPDNPYSKVEVEHRDSVSAASVEEYYTDPLTGVRRLDHQYAYRTDCYSWGCDFNKGPLADYVDQVVVSKLISQLNLEKASTGVALAEAGKTAEHVAKTALRIAKAFRSLKKLQLGEFAKALGLARREFPTIEEKMRHFRRKSRWSASDTTDVKNFAANTWLEYSYAWKPLLQDVYQHAEALAELLVEHQWVIREAKAKSQGAVLGPYREDRGSNMWTYFKSSRDERFVAMEVRYRIKEGNVPVSRALGLDNPLEIAWELVPFSFVVDWFIPIGDALKNLTAYDGLEFHSGWKTVRNHHKITTGWFYSQPTASGQREYYGAGASKAEKEWFEMTRSRLASFPQYGLPAFKDPRSFAHAASAIALLKTVFAR